MEDTFSILINYVIQNTCSYFEILGHPRVVGHSAQNWPNWHDYQVRYAHLAIMPIWPILCLAP